MQFKDFFYLQESFDYIPENINKTIKDRGNEVDVSYTFDIGKYSYDVVFSINKQTKSANFLFAITNEEFDNPIGVLSLEPGMGQKIFGSVANIFKQFITHHIRSIKEVYFTANKKDPSRVRLYDRFIHTGFIKTNFDVDIDERELIKKYILTPKINANDNNL